MRCLGLLGVTRFAELDKSDATGDAEEPCTVPRSEEKSQKSFSLPLFSAAKLSTHRLRRINRDRTRIQTEPMSDVHEMESLQRAEASVAGQDDAAAQGLWRAIRESLRGTHRDYTQGPVGRSIILLAIPMVLEMLMESVFVVVDIFWVAHLGADAIATVGLTESMLTLMYAIAIGLGIGATAMVARRIGERDPEGAARAAVQAIAVGLVVSVVVAVLGVTFSKSLLAAMGGSPWVLEHGSIFTRIMLGGNASILLLFLINAIFRGTAMQLLRCEYSGWQTSSTLYSAHASSSDLALFPNWA